MNKYGIIVQATEEFLKKFLSDRVLHRLDVLEQTVKPMILRNWGISIFDEKIIECKAQYDVKSDRFLFRLRSDRPVIGFVCIAEGCKYPMKRWFLD